MLSSEQVAEIKARAEAPQPFHAERKADGIWLTIHGRRYRGNVLLSGHGPLVAAAIEEAMLRTEQEPTATTDRDALLADRDELVRRLAKVIPETVDDIEVIRGGHLMSGKSCRLCGCVWADGYDGTGKPYTEPAAHVPACPAAPAEGGA